jgi:hypothetical protein
VGAGDVDPARQVGVANSNNCRQKPLSVTGTLSYLPFDRGSSYQPLGGQRVNLYDPGTTNAVAAGTTNAAGDFSIKVPTAGRLSTSLTVGAGGPQDNPLFDPADVALPMAVEVPTAITNFHATLSQYGKLSFSGCLNLQEKAPTSVTNSSRVDLQYSSGASGSPRLPPHP